jgi:hypothetical protein
MVIKLYGEKLVAESGVDAEDIECKAENHEVAPFVFV